MRFLSIPYRYVAHPNFIFFGGYLSFIHKGLGCIWLVTKVYPTSLIVMTQTLPFVWMEPLYQP